MDKLSDFIQRKFVAPEFIFGIDARHAVIRYVRNLGARRVLVVTDPGVEAAGWSTEAVARLTEAGVEHVVFRDVSSNPRAEEVMAGADLYLRERCNCIIAVGGGSPMDCAKGIGIVSASPGMNILEFEGVDAVSAPTPPIICVPTTAGTAADVSQFAIITDVPRRVKIAIISKTIVPDVALIDPVATTTMDPYLTACTAIDALCHGFESYVSRANSPITDVHALAAIPLLWRTLPLVLQEPDNMVYRARMMLGSLHAGLAFSNASLGAVHAMAHSIGGLLDFAHGEANALLLAPVIRFNFDVARQRYRRLAELLHVVPPGAGDDEVCDALVAAVDSLRRSAGITGTLGSLGMKESDIPELARKALNDACIVTNPRLPTQNEVERLYESAA